MVALSKTQALETPLTPLTDEEPIEFTIAETKSARIPKLSERTDYTRWRLLDEAGRQTWHYLEEDEDAKEWPQSTADKYFLSLPTVDSH